MKPSELIVILTKIKLKISLPNGVTSPSLLPKLIRTKNIKQLQDGSITHPTSKHKLTKCLDTFDLTSLGVGSCCGTGMYLVAGIVAKNIAGPGVIVSFIIAAVASIFSGACYAEFGVRVPHTSGSAYMYSYVAVGEFVAFIIGWNMILEYLIGTSACACALSSSFDSLTDGVITSTIRDSFGTIFGKPPDFIAFGITLLMTCILGLGATKSVLFNHVLNAINVSTWIFIITAGLFYVDISTWTEHQGFLPYGWSGVFSGAATCFYAFIGFDIIATTGEETHNPQKSIPKAIFGSLFIVLLAYVSVSLVLTLVVPYDHINTGSALVHMWSYVNASKCRAIVAIGATAGLSVAMFGSMFPMPRIIYAMAQDGLIFRQLSQLWQHTPGLATICSGVAAAFVALTVRLEVLVEMMSIGTLLAYTLVSTCVLILRYQPHSTSLVELLPAQLRTPIMSNKTTNNPCGNTAEAFDSSILTLKRVTRGLSDSDDSLIDESSDGYIGRDDQFLVSDCSENKFYGSIHGAPTGPTGRANTFETIGLNLITRKLDEYSYLCPGFFPWVNPGHATTESGMYVTKLVGIMFGLIFLLDLFAAIGWCGGFAAFIYFILFAAIIAILLVISRQPQNKYALAFLTPGLPFIPSVAIAVNIYLIFKLSILTLVRFTIWMFLGFIMYFYYGITHSTLEQSFTDDLELKVDQDFSKKVEENVIWDQSLYMNDNRGFLSSNKSTTSTKPTTKNHNEINSYNTSNTKKSVASPSQKSHTSSCHPSKGANTSANGLFSMFVDETQHPKWDD